MNERSSSSHRHALWQSSWAGKHGLSEALSLLGLTRLNIGDPSGSRTSSRASKSPPPPGRSTRWLAAITAWRWPSRCSVTSTPASQPGSRESESPSGSAPRGCLRWFKGVLVDHRYRRGEWDEALRAADEFIAEIEAGSPHYSSFQVYAVRAEMRSARGDSAGAIRDAERALAAGRALDDAQALFFVPCGLHARLRPRVGESTGLVALARELLDALGRGVGLQFAVINLPTFVSALAMLDLSPELVDALAGQLETAWTEAVRAYARGDFAAAAEILQRTARSPRRRKPASAPRSSSSPRVARAEADEQLQQALAFYRSVDATRFVRECEALLTASPARD